MTTPKQTPVSSGELYPLIDRLQKCSEINHPTRKWSNEFYYECAFQWKDKIPELKIRVETLEAALVTTPSPDHI